MKQVFNFSNWCRLLKLLPALVVLLLPQLSQAQSATVVISQVYGGGGSSSINPSPAFNQDYVEIFNRSTSPQAIGGFTLQYTSANGTGSFAMSSPIPAGTMIAAGRYYLVALGYGIGTSTPLAGATLSPTPDFTPSATLNLSATDGKLALVNGTTALTAASAANGPSIIDFVGYGSANLFEGNGPVGVLSTTTAALRVSSGCTDTNQNAVDFTVGSPTPRNSNSVINACVAPVLVANPATLTFTAATGQVANTTTYTLAGYNLGANVLITISSSNAAVLVSTTGALGSFVSTASVATSAAGTITQTITVQFTAPAVAGTTSATISNSDGTRTASVAVTGTAIEAYTWNGTSTSFSNSTSWTPARPITPGPADVLLINGANTPTTTITLDYASAQTIGRLLFINNVTATLTTDVSRTLTLANDLPGDDFSIEAGSMVTVANSSTTTPAGLTIMLASPETARVSGRLTFTGSNAMGLGQHSLQSTTAGAIQFLAGSTFSTTSTYEGGSTTRPFGRSTMNANSVIFRNGSRYEQFGGNNPFGLGAPSSVFVLEPSSYFLFGISGNEPSLAGRTYGTLEYNVATTSTATVASSSPVIIQGDLIVTNGSVTLNLTGSGGIGGVVIQGNVQVSNAASLNFGANSMSTLVQLNGTMAQTLGSNSSATTPISFGSAATLQINNAAGVVLGLPITVPGTLQLTSGLLTTTIARSLILPATASVSYTTGSNASFVNGPVVRPLSALGTYVFPVGKGTAFRPFTLAITAPTTALYYYRAEQFEGNPGQNVTGSGLTRVSQIRSFTVSPFASAGEAMSTSSTAAQPSLTGFKGTATLSFGPDDVVTDPTQLVVAKRASAASPWVNIGYSSNSTAANTVTSGEFTTFSDFALGSTDPNTTINPLPVTLTSFSATRQASGAVQVRWATASEQHSAYFEVQRSLDGNTFIIVDKVAAAGTTTQSHTYASLDTQAPAGQLYYRLRQVDIDGIETFSPVVSLAATATLSLYPNPAHDQLTIAAAGEEVQVSDLTGRVLQTTTLPASGKLNVEALPAGTYLLRVSPDGHRQVLRFTKE
ncbi:MAG: T9SS type A sorting domain-containing protein [Janthinobacterium lividum]